MKKSLMIVASLVLGLGVCFGADNFLRSAGTVQYTNPGAAISTGDLVDLGNRYGVALVDIASNGTGSVRTEGVFQFVRSETNAITMDLPLYYASASAIKIAVTADKYVGVAVEASGVIGTAAVANATSLIAVELNATRRPVGLASGEITATGTATIVEGQVTEAD